MRCAPSTGALGFETIEVETVFDGDTLHDVRPQKGGAEPGEGELVIAKPDDRRQRPVTAAGGFLDARGVTSMSRVVKSPRAMGSPPRPDGAVGRPGSRLTPTLSRSRSYRAATRKEDAANRSRNLSTSIIRLLAAGELNRRNPTGAEPPGHFRDSRVRDYSQSTAPNQAVSGW